ncbi:MAG: FG-GAP-like repeat-containing protein, partial [Deltaproteobacteria bacterium]
SIVAASLLAAALTVAAAVAFRHRVNSPESLPVEPGAAQATAKGLRPLVTAFCGDCHGLPSPEGFPKQAWHEEVKKGFDFYFDSGRTDLSPPNFDQVVAWFRNQAPDEILIARQPEAPNSGALQFRVTDIAGAVDGDGAGSLPAVSFIKWCAIADPGRQMLLWTDMRSGELRTADPRLPHAPPSLVGQLAHPAHAELCDPDGDGRIDLVVAELGSFQPADHAEGKVIWLRQTADGGWQPKVIQAGLGRVADVEPGDFDGDGDVDLVIAEFGWRKTGRILLLENLGNNDGEPDFQMRVVDPRHGTIHVPAVDLDGDGRLDFVALISQEHEAVVAFLNDGRGGFRRETIFAANEPAFGSSGIQLVDLDGDGDLDVLYTNGDTFDSFYLKPYHSIRWLENQGRFPFQDHLLAAMPGVHRALACDLDGDGDLDIVACSLLPRRILGRERPADLESLLWLEQTSTGNFIRHGLERETSQHAALEVGDFDGDGDIDLTVGNFADAGRPPALTVWWNLGSDAARDHEP